MKLAPVILFAYNRPEHTRQTLVSLRDNHLSQESSLFIYIDGPKPNATDEQIHQIDLVKKVAKEEKWCSEVHIVESESNKGLSASIIKGVTGIVNQYGRVIVLEDDLISDKWFLKFMNDGLTIYESDTDVVCLTGYIYPVKKNLPETFLLKGADCWGWATWKRGWDLLDTDAEKLLKELETKNLTSDFNFGDTYPYVQMLKDQIAKKNNSWAILWYASAYLKNKYTLYPGHSLIHNIGIDGSGTHSGTSSSFDINLKHHEIKVEKLNAAENKEAKKIVAEYFASLNSTSKPSLFKRLLNKLTK